MQICNFSGNFIWLFATVWVLFVLHFTQEIVTEMLRQYNKQLDNQQMNNLMAKQASQNPLWLSIACEELRVYGVYEKVTDKINMLADGLIE